MTRALQNSLALANVKVKHGWEGEPLHILEPRLSEELGRKRPASSNNETISDSSSSISGDFSSVPGLASSPLTVPMFSDDFDRSGSAPSAKRQKLGNKSLPYPASSSQTGRKSRNAATVQSWKRTHRLPQSSPLTHTRHAPFIGTTHISKLSFISEGSTVVDERTDPELSEDDDADLPVHSFDLQPSMIHSSPPPPCTPPPAQRRMINHEANVSWSRTPKTGEEGADLLMFLAGSPTPANKKAAKARVQAPSTPPSKTTPLPSSIMRTPGGSGLFGLAPNTPSNNFNFADFCNVTPSPAQGHWGPKTPATAKTPLAASSARRRINFDALPPPSSITSPRPGRVTRRSSAGLGMDLDGDQIS